MKKIPVNYLNLFIYLLIIAVTLWIGYIMVYGKGGIVRRNELRKELAIISREIDELSSQKDKLQWEIEHLSNDERYIQGFAHDSGYRLEDEMIFKFIERDKLEGIR